MQTPLFLTPAGDNLPPASGRERLTGWERIALADAELLYNPCWYTAEQSDILLQILLHDTPWQQKSLRFGGKLVAVPRLQAWYGSEDSSYSYSGLSMRPLPWTPALLAIKSRLETALSLQFNSVLLNYYRDGRDSVAWHSDNERELGLDPVIASLSFGAVRRFELKPRARQQCGHRVKVCLPLHSGSVVLMGKGLQQHWQHQVPKEPGIAESRINLTFRLIRRVATCR